MIKQFNSEDKVLFIDFDHTCYDTDDFLLNEIRQPMLNSFNIPVEIWEQSYKNSAQIGYSLEQHLNELNKIIDPSPCSLLEIQSLGYKINFSKYLYPDTVSVLKSAKEKGYKIVILSFGAVSWQDKKIFGSGLDKIVDFIEYVTFDENNSKAEIIKKYTSNCSKIIFVDNKGSNLDTVHQIFPKVETYFINRVPNDAMNLIKNDQIRIKYLESRRIAENKTIFEHKNCKTFNEIMF